MSSVLNDNPLELSESLQQTISLLVAAGASVYVTGGAVRDHLMGIQSSDIDIEVHSIEPQKLYDTLANDYSVHPCGKNFSVLKLKVENSDIDIAVPAVDGEPSPYCGLREACKRRDLTINAIAYEPATEIFHDPFNGMEDLRTGSLRATDRQTFIEDPLRVLRVLQFAARFGFQPTESTIELCTSIQTELHSIPIERIKHELEKMWINGKQIAHAFALVPKLGLDDFFSILPGLIKSSTRTNLISAHDIIAANNLDRGMALSIFWALSLESLSAPEAEQVLDHFKVNRIASTNARKIILAAVCHSDSLMARQPRGMLTALADQAHLRALFYVAQAKCTRSENDNRAAELLQLNRIDAEAMQVMDAPLPPLLHGNQLISLGLKGIEIGNCLRFIRNAQHHSGVSSTEEALKLAEQWIQSK